MRTSIFRRSAQVHRPPERTLLPAEHPGGPGPATDRAVSTLRWLTLTIAAATLVWNGDGVLAQTPTADLPPALSDLAVRFRARAEFGGDWALFRPCDATIQVTCEPGLIPQLQPDIQFGLESAGSIADRLFVDLDYDQTREFAGANRFQVFYQGQEGEFLQRLEVGDVTFSLPETRFLTRDIPVGNFGVLVGGRVGDVEVQTDALRSSPPQ